MAITARLKRATRLAIAPIKGFFTWKTTVKRSAGEPAGTTKWAHIKVVARRDTALFYEPFINARLALREERAKA